MNSHLAYTLGDKYSIGHEGEENAIDRKGGNSEGPIAMFSPYAGSVFSPICRGEGIHVAL